jgi:uncharacterized protein with PIN domain
MAEYTFLEIAQLLQVVRDECQWTILGYDGFEEYILDLNLPVQRPYSWAMRLLRIYETIVLPMGLKSETAAVIGITRLTRLLPLARSGELTDSILIKASQVSDMELRALVGHTVSDSATELEPSKCPRCGEDVICAKCGEKILKFGRKRKDESS